MKKPVHTWRPRCSQRSCRLSAATARGSAVQGEVRKIDEAAGKVTPQARPDPGILGMDVGMTMTFRVKDPAMLGKCRSATRVEFERREQAASGYTVTKMQKSN